MFGYHGGSTRRRKPCLFMVARKQREKREGAGVSIAPSRTYPNHLTSFL
jgi:hypothetical protein